METEQSHIHFQKRIIDLEARCEQLEEDKDKLMEQVMGLKADEGKAKDKYAKWKKKNAELKEKFDSEGTKWKEELMKSLHKYWRLEVEKRQLEIDFKAAQDGDKESEKLRAEVERLKILLEDSEGRIRTLVTTIDVLERHCSSLGKDLQAKLATQEVEEEKKMFELCQMIQDLEREKGEECNRGLNENMALKEEHNKKILELVLTLGSLEREKGKLEKDNRKKDEKIMELMQEKERLAANKMKMEMNRRGAKSEGAIELLEQLHPTSNLAILDTLTPSINQGEKPDEHRRYLNYGATASDQDSKKEDNTMATSVNGSTGKRPSPENLSGGDSSTAKRARPSV